MGGEGASGGMGVVGLLEYMAEVKREEIVKKWSAFGIDLKEPLKTKADYGQRL